MFTRILVLLSLGCAAGQGFGDSDSYKNCDSITEQAAYQTCLSREESKERATREYYRKQFEPKKRTICEQQGTRTVCEEE